VTDYTHIASGKVRDLYEMDDGRLLFVASDRISAYDFVLPTPIPDKGRVLTAMSIWWFEQLADVVPNHLLSTDVPPEFKGRAMICERLDMLPVECIARGYLTGSGLADYRRTGAVSGIALPPGLVDGSRLPKPLFTPSTKAPIGEHDENISLGDVEDTVGPDAAAELEQGDALPRGVGLREVVDRPELLRIKPGPRGARLGRRGGPRGAGGPSRS